MVFVTKTIPSIAELQPLEKKEGSLPDICRDVGHNSMVGILDQLAIIAEFANTVFSGLLQESQSTFTRMSALTGRISSFNQQASNIENYIVSTGVKTLLNNPRGTFNPKPPIQDAQFLEESNSPAVRVLYSKASDPPNLAILDPFMEDGQKSLELYTNPSFFLEAWFEEQLKLRDEAKKARRERKKKRQLRQKPKTGPEQQVEVTRLKVAKYDPITGEKILVDPDDVPTPSQSGQDIKGTFTPATQTPLDNSSSQYIERGPSIPNYQDFLEETPPPPPMDDDFAPPPPPPMDDDFTPPPPLDEEFTPPPPLPVLEETPNLPPRDVSHMSPPAVRAAIPPPVAKVPLPPPATKGVPSPTPPPPPVPAAPGAPPPPPSTLGGGGLSLSALQGARLKAVEIKPKPADERTNLLESIRQKNVQLKSATERKLAERATEVPKSVADILARRIAIVGSSSEEDEEEWSD